MLKLDGRPVGQLEGEMLQDVPDAVRVGIGPARGLGLAAVLHGLEGEPGDMIVEPAALVALYELLQDGPQPVVGPEEQSASGLQQTPRFGQGRGAGE